MAKKLFYIFIVILPLLLQACEKTTCAMQAVAGGAGLCK
jgi:hypothetical protein